MGVQPRFFALNTLTRSLFSSARLSARRWSCLGLLTVCVACIDKPNVARRELVESGGAGGEVGGAGSGGGAGDDVDVTPSAGAAGAAGDNATIEEDAGPAPSSPAEIVVNVSYQVARQKIDGFGIATSWSVIPPSPQLDAFFSVSKGAGLSILRNRIPFRENPTANDAFMGGGNYDFTTAGTGADAYKTFSLNWNNWDLYATRKLIGVLKENPDYQVPTYISAPWTPPNNNTSRWKLNVADYVNLPEVGGHLDPAHYQDYADVLADYVLGFESNMGVPLAALSLQNEPNFQASYESANWSADQLHAFLLVLRSEFSKKGVFSALPGFTILAPEADSFREDLILPSLADSNTASLIGIVGAHQYDFGPWNVDIYSPKPLSASLAAGKKVWVTEWNTDAFTTETPFSKALLLARLIQTDLTSASVSAYVHWWYKDLVDSAGSPNKNLWAIGQFSRFVRPGSVLLEAPKSKGDDLLLAAFKDAAGSTLTLVAINRGAVDMTFAIELDSGTLGSVMCYRTSESEDLAKAASAASGGRFANVTAKAQSISTFVASVRP